MGTLFLLASCRIAQSANDRPSMALDNEAYLVQKLLTQTDHLEFYFYDDFDNDGSFEMFAACSPGPNFEIWYISQSDILKLGESGSSFSEEESSVLYVSGHKFAVFWSATGNGFTVYMYGMRDHLPFETSISQKHHKQSPSSFKVNAYNELLMELSSYNAFSNGTGATYIPYYFYLADGDFREYGGIPITLHELYGIKGVAEILSEQLTADDEITSIYCRGNGIVNINYRTDWGEYGYRNRYITLRVSGADIIIEDTGSGIYTDAFLPDIADYPSAFIGQYADLNEWIGDYRFNEGKSSHEFIAYEIRIYAEEGGYYASIRVNGWMTGMLATAEVQGDEGN